MSSDRKVLLYILAAIIGFAAGDALATAWDASFEATPANTDAVGAADDRIRELKDDIRERLETISDFGEFGNITTDTGRMLAGVARIFSQSSAPTVDGTTSASCYPEDDFDGNDHCSGNELWHDTDDNSVYVSIDSGSDGDADSWQQLAPLGTKTIFIPAAGMRPATSSGAAPLTQVELTGGQPELVVLDFDGTSDEFALFNFTFPDSWNEGTITFKVYYTVSSAVSTDVAWYIQCAAVSDNDAINTTYGTLQAVGDTFHGTANDLAVTAATSALTVGGTPAAGDMTFCRIGRDPDETNGQTDDTSQDARLLGVQGKYTVDAYNDD